MQDKQFKEKYNDGCIKIFNLLKLMYEDKADYEDVMAIFAGDEPDAERQHVTLNKFINALKVFGMEIEKTNKKFKTKNIPFGIKFDLNDLHAIALLTKYVDNLPNGKTKADLVKFIELLRNRFDKKTEKKYEALLKNSKKDYSFYCSELREKIEKAEEICAQKYKLSITYLKKGEEIQTFCIAEEVVYDNKNAYLKILKTKENERENILLSNILEVKYLPTQKTEKDITKTVVFKLTGRLAKNYQLKEGEHLSRIEDDGSIIVVNQSEPINLLIRRLRRYGTNCIIQGPEDVKREFIKNLDSGINLYK